MHAYELLVRHLHACAYAWCMCVMHMRGVVHGHHGRGGMGTGTGMGVHHVHMHAARARCTCGRGTSSKLGQSPSPLLPWLPLPPPPPPPDPDPEFAAGALAAASRLNARPMRESALPMAAAVTAGGAARARCTAPAETGPSAALDPPTARPARESWACDEPDCTWLLPRAEDGAEQLAAGAGRERARLDGNDETRPTPLAREATAAPSGAAASPWSSAVAVEGCGKAFDEAPPDVSS